MATPPQSHLQAVLQHDIDLICAKLLEMLALDEQALTRAPPGFLRRDRQLAYSVILRDQDATSARRHGNVGWRPGGGMDRLRMLPGTPRLPAHDRVEAAHREPAAAHPSTLHRRTAGAMA